VRANHVPPIAQQLLAFTELSRAYGAWGLAFLEALVVSADRAVSAREGAAG
jgi:hypothetical protein